MITKFLLALTLLVFICNGLGPRIYTGTANLGALSLEINILAGYGNNGDIKDGVNVTLIGTEISNAWIGVGFAASMVLRYIFCQFWRKYIILILDKIILLG